MDKVYLSTTDQIHKLLSRGMVIANAVKAKHIIEMENYYNLINGYKQPFPDALTPLDRRIYIGRPQKPVYLIAIILCSPYQEAWMRDCSKKWGVKG